MVKYLTGKPTVWYSKRIVGSGVRCADLVERRGKKVADQFVGSHAFQKTQILGAIKSLNFL